MADDSPTVRVVLVPPEPVPMKKWEKALTATMVILLVWEALTPARKHRRA